MLLFVALAHAGEPLVFEPVPVKAPPPRPELVIVPERLPTGEQVTAQIERDLSAELSKKAEEVLTPR